MCALKKEGKFSSFEEEEDDDDYYSYTYDVEEKKEKLVEDDHDAKAEIQAFPKGDLILLVEGKELYVNKDILMEASPVFRAMLESDFKESTQDRIELPGKSYEAMVEFLKCTFTFINSFITGNNVLKILPLADEYQTSLKKRCEEFMINVLRGKESFFIHRTDTLESEQHGCDNENSVKKSSHFIRYHTDLPKETHSDTTPSSGFNFGQQKPQQPYFGGPRIPIAVSGSSNKAMNSRPDSKQSIQFTQSKPDATSVDKFNNIGFGKNGFEVGNTVPTGIVVEYILEAEKYGCNDFLKIAIQYVAMRQFSHFESVRGFSEISMDTRLKITMLRLRILENYQSNGLDLNTLLFRV